MLFTTFLITLLELGLYVLPYVYCLLRAHFIITFLELYTIKIMTEPGGISRILYNAEGTIFPRRIRRNIRLLT